VTWQSIEGVRGMNQDAGSVYPGGERRLYKRIAKPFMTKFRILKDEPSQEDSASWDMVVVKNLGAGGILFNYDKKMDMGSLLDLKINFPASEQPIKCTGKVIRIEDTPHPSVVRIAAVFTEISEEEKAMINNLAEGFYSNRPGRIAP